MFSYQNCLRSFIKFGFGFSLQVMVTNVTSLLKTVKAVEDEHTRGTRALESTIEAMGQEIRVSFIQIMVVQTNFIFTISHSFVQIFIRWIHLSSFAFWS